MTEIVEFDDYDDDADLFGYWCMSCGHIQEYSHDHTCEICCGPVDEYFG